MDARSIHLQDLQIAINYLNTVMADVTPEQAHSVPEGTVQTIAATYAHALLASDVQCHRRIQDVPALWQEGEWAGKTGISECVLRITPEWGKQVQVDLAQSRAYGDAVFAAMTEFVSTVDLDREMDLSAMGAGQKTVSWWISQGVIAHLLVLTGEIVALKGIQGLKGDMF
jgi:hypothetical protein